MGLVGYYGKLWEKSELADAAHTGTKMSLSTLGAILENYLGRIGVNHSRNVYPAKG
jgi:hypothetical protein